MIHVDETDPVSEIEQSFPYRDVTIKRGRDAKELYDLITEVGRGKFGTVYKCSEKSTGLQFAGKFIPIPKREDRRNVEREVDIMNKLQHPRIIQLYDAYEFGKMMCVVLELIDGGELFERVIDDDFILTEKACVIFVRQVCEAIEFVHRNYIIHLDLKPENILCLTREGNRIKIIDFGLARKFDPDKKLQVLFGTPEFVAPEVVNFDTIFFGTDMWSIGVICYVLLSGLSPFMGETDIETMANVTIAKYDFEDDAFADVSEDAIDFISKLLVKDSRLRMSASECLQHKWLRKKSLKPQLAPKPATIPPPKLKPRTPTEELDQTKDNLKQFVERWSEHPNSPYIFDTETQYIIPVIDLQNDTQHQLQQDNLIIPEQDTSNLSSRDYIKIQNGTSAGCSPSPCGSLNSGEDILERDKYIDEFANTEQPSAAATTGTSTTASHNKEYNQQIEEESNDKDLRNYLHSFDRRNSDSSYVLKPNSSQEKFNLADEIKKLSDHLLMLSTINTDLKNYIPIKNDNSTNSNDKIQNNIINKNLTNDYNNAEILAEKKTTLIVSNNNNNVENLEYLQIPPRSKLSECFNRSVSIPTINKVTVKFRTSPSVTEKLSPGEGCINGYIEKFDNKINRTFNHSNSFSVAKSHRMNGTATSISSNKIENKIKENITITRKGSFRNVSDNNGIHNNSFYGGAPWPITNRRTKFRINQMSRDVPACSPNTHQTFFMEEAANATKDCLLHLLEKYNEGRDFKNEHMNGRHQSISEWGLADNLEYRSMNSINTFFQRHATSGSTVKQIQNKIEGKK